MISALQQTRVRVGTVFFKSDGSVPNNPALPVVIMKTAVPSGKNASEICTLMASNGWGGNWVWTVFDYHHFQPNAHEALAVASGWADIQLGGPAGQIFRVTRGDTLVLPAGIGHCRIATSPDFAACGGYPSGQHSYETLRAAAPCPAGTPARIASVSLPRTDPILGANGPLIAAWHNATRGP